MAHFATIDNSTNKVINVEVVNNAVITDSDGNEQEQLGIDFLEQIHGGGAGTGYWAVNDPSYGGGDGGTGGGGNGCGRSSPIQRLPAAGTTNTGSGGGGGGNYSLSPEGTACQPSGAGGSGVVIIKMAAADYSGTTTGSPSVTTSGKTFSIS